ncbi:MAG: amino acid adenylation domain-containing protein, partial [Planctomycetes bacterium]|nr:amino acid adenylation domain-containing protein [Planctomycetota bacterium]
MSQPLPNLHAYFERSAAQYPERTALVIPGWQDEAERQELTFGELDRRASALAATLPSQSIIGLAIPRSQAEAYVGMLAILKAGSAYTFLDPAFPADRQAKILRDAEVELVLSEDDAQFPGATAHPYGGWPAPAEAETLPAVPGTDLAYAIYTSGTTGEPKGVLIEHRSICNLIESDLEAFQLTPDDRVAQGSSLAYDSSVEEIWMAWSAGAAVVVLHDQAVRMGPDLVPWLRTESIHVLCPTPTLLRTLGVQDPASELPELKLIYIGGEALTQDLVDLWAPTKWLENGYGPTECSVTVVRGRVRTGEPITIGRPVPGNEAWILDEEGSPVKEGDEGELCIRGAGLARGYHRRPELTAQKFEQHADLGRIYHTGDKVFRDGDGNLHYRGRMDQQVKLRGYRIELLEVEAQLQALAGVREAACAIVGVGAAANLVGLLVAEEQPGDGAQLQPALRERVPEYMVPTRLHWVEALPTGVSGKLDRRAVLARAQEFQPALHGEVERERGSEVEERILAAMVEALPAGSDFTLDGDFFLDLGGDSLGAATLISLLRRHASTAPLTVRDVYEHRTARELAKCLAHAVPTQDHNDAPPIPNLTPASQLDPTAATFWQVLWLAGSMTISLAVLYGLVVWGLPAAMDRFGMWPTLIALGWLGLLLPWLWLVPSVQLTRLAKRLLIGEYTPGAIPAWSSAHVRHWIVQRISATIPWGRVQGTCLHNWVLRSLGAKVGRDVYLHRGVGFPLGGWDLIELGDGVTVCQDAELRPVEWHAGHLILGRVVLGEQATVDVRAGLSPGAKLGARSYLRPHAWLPGHVETGSNETWDGVPAKPVGPAPETPRAEGVEWGARTHAMRLILA